jgi:hypothetical protein
MAKKKITAPSTSNAGTSAAVRWTVEETTCLLEYLIAHRAEAGDGTGFKQSTFTGASTHLQEPPEGVSKENHVAGSVRDWQSCKNKWLNVRSPLMLDYILIVTCTVQKKICRYCRYQISIRFFMGRQTRCKHQSC